MRVCRGGRVKNWYFSLKDSEEGGISEIKIQKKKSIQKKSNSEITTTQFQNPSLKKARFYGGLLEKKSSGTHCTDLILLC